MTFTNNSTEKSLQLNTAQASFKDIDETEVAYFNKVIWLSSILLLLISSFFIYNTFFHKENAVHADKTDYSNTVVANNTLAENTFKNEVVSPKMALLKLVEEKNIFQISSSNRDGFYVMVGTFANYKNAVKLEKMNPTKFTCHIFEPNYNNLNRVGLFIDETDVRKAENALKEIRNMQPKSWLMYNSRH